MGLNINNKILLTVIPIFSLIVGIYFSYEIISTHQQFQDDFDNTIERSIQILRPTIANNIYNLDQNSTNSALKGLFHNKSLEEAILFDENGVFFAGLKRVGENNFENMTNKESLNKYLQVHNLKDKDAFITENLTNGTRRYISSIFSTDKDNLKYQGIFVIDASTSIIKTRTFYMAMRLIMGLIVGIFIAGISTYFIAKKMISKPLLNLTKEIGIEAHNIYDSSKNLSTTFQKVAQATQSQSESVAETADDMRNIATSVGRTKQNATDCNSVVHVLNKKTIDGNHLMQVMTNSVMSIQKSSSNLEKISTIIKNISLKTRVIHEIVAKTEILSINAAIEAARAGDLGRGFSVVAEEVGNLAKISGNAAKDIETLIMESQSIAQSVIGEMSGSVEMVQKNTLRVSNSFQEIAQGVETILENTKNIQTATEEQNTAIQNINHSIHEMNQFNKTTHKESQNALTLAKELDKKSETLTEIMQSMYEIIHGQKKDNRV